jgi:hypothetical protein
LGEPEDNSRSKDFAGRRMIRIDGGFLILNFMKYRDKDHTAAIRQQRLRDRRKAEKIVTRDVEESRRDDTLQERDEALPSRNITQADSRLQSTDTDKKQKPSRKRVKIKTEPTKTDLKLSRHAELKAAILEYWKAKNPGVEMPWAQAEGIQLDNWMKAAPNTTVEQFKGFLRNRYKSAVNHTERPSRWIGNVTSFASGPIDQFGKPQNGGSNGHNGQQGQNGANHGSATRQRVVNNLEALFTATLEKGFEGDGDGDTASDHLLPRTRP